MRLIYIIALIFILMGSGCKNESLFNREEAENLSFVASRASFESNSPDDKINNVTAFHFIDNKLVEKVSATPNEKGMYNLNIKDKTGDVYFVANAENEPSLSNISLGENLDNFLNTCSFEEISVDNGLLMTGYIKSKDLYTGQTISMKRSVARLDIDVKSAGIYVHNVKIMNVASGGYIFSQNTGLNQGEISYNDIEKNYSNPLSNTIEPLCYLYEQNGNDIVVRVNAIIDGNDSEVDAVLPSIIERNKVYRLKVYSFGTELKAEVVNFTDWETGGTNDSELTTMDFLDINLSEFGDSIKINEKGDSLYIPYRENLFKIKFNIEENHEIKILGDAYKADVNIYSGTRDVVQVHNELRMPGISRDYMSLDIIDDRGMSVSNMTLVFMNNPVILENNRLKFDENGVSDFGTYADGEFATFVLPEGRKMEITIDEEQDKWAKLIKMEDREGAYRLLGGWKPNDPKADGREQSLIIKISDINGARPETYVVKRRNIAMPVVNLYGVWWCKYNAIGNSKRIEDQITLTNDPAAAEGKTVAEYLRTCSPEEYMRLWGWNYIGSSGQGMKVTYSNDKWVYEGYTTNPDMNLIDVNPKSIAPDGYELPSMSDFNQIIKAGMKMNITGFYTFGDGKKRHGTHFERKDILSTGQSVYHLHVQDNNHKEIEGVTLYGSGSQWNYNGINVDKLFIASYKNGWFHDGSYRVYAGNKNDSRILRFKKSNVEYIYE